MEEIGPFLCKLCLFKSEATNGGEIYLESNNELTEIIAELFHNQVRLSGLDIDNICTICRDKLKSFYEYYKFVLENQIRLKTGNVKGERPLPALVGSVSKIDDPEFVLIVKEEPKDFIEPDELIEYKPFDDEDLILAPSDVDDDAPDIKAVVEMKINTDEEVSIKRPRDEEGEEMPVPKKPKKKWRRSKVDPEAARKQKEKYEAEEQLIKKYVKLACAHCQEKTNEEFNSFNDLAKHAKKKHKNDILIYCCSRKFRARHTLLPHVKIDHVIGPKFSCDECGEKFKSEIRLKTHHKLKHLFCQYCGLDMRSRKMRDNIWSHTQQHLLSPDPTKLAPCICDLCGKKLKDRTRVHMHLQYVHFRNVKYMCELCGIDFTTTSSYNQHQLIKHSDGEFSCFSSKICV